MTFQLAPVGALLLALVGLALLVALVATAAALVPAVRANRRTRLARHESLRAYYGHRTALTH